MRHFKKAQLSPINCLWGVEEKKRQKGQKAEGKSEERRVKDEG